MILSKILNTYTDVSKEDVMKARSEYESVLNGIAVVYGYSGVKVNWVDKDLDINPRFFDSHSSVELIRMDGHTININTNMNSLQATIKAVIEEVR